MRLTMMERAALWLVRHLLSMECFLLFFLVPAAFVFVPGLAWGKEWVLLISSAILQLCFLPLIGVGQSVQARIAEAHRNEIEDAATKRHEEALARLEAGEIATLALVKRIARLERSNLAVLGEVRRLCQGIKAEEDMIVADLERKGEPT